MRLFKYSDKGLSMKLYYFERKFLSKCWNIILGRNYTFKAENYTHTQPQMMKFRPYAATINSYELDGLSESEQIIMLGTRFNELVNQYNHMLDIANIEGEL